MTLVLQQQSWGGYDWVYQRQPGELADLERRYDERQRDVQTVRLANPEPTTLASLIRQGMRLAKITNGQLAERVGVRSTAVCNWTSGRCAPSNVNMAKVCSELHLDYQLARRLAARDPKVMASEVRRGWNGGQYVERTV